jgi:hypothetical protein
MKPTEHTNAHAHAHARTCTRTHARTHTCTHTCTHKQTQTHTHTGCTGWNPTHLQCRHHSLRPSKARERQNRLLRAVLFMQMGGRLFPATGSCADGCLWRTASLLARLQSPPRPQRGGDGWRSTTEAPQTACRDRAMQRLVTLSKAARCSSCLKYSKLTAERGLWRNKEQRLAREVVR